jgi:hypothetical protein
MNQRQNITTNNYQPNFHQYILTNFGNKTHYNIINTEKLHTKSSKTKERLTFLIKCRKNKIIPKFLLTKTNKMFKHINNRPHPYNFDNFREKIKKKFLDIEIKITAYTVRKTNKQIVRNMNNLKNILPHNTYDSFHNCQRKKSDNISKRTKFTLENKFQNLIDQQPSEADVIYDEQNIINLTSIELPIEVKILLSFGPTFSPPVPVKDCPYLKILSDIEHTINNYIKPWLHNEMRANITEKLTKYMNRKRPVTKIEKFITDIFEKTREFVNRHKDIIITRSDKGNKTVIMKKQEYDQKMEDMLSDQETYIRLDNDPTREIERKNNNLIQGLYDSGYIDNKTKLHLKSDIAVPARIYGLPKYHKEGNPLRPIVSTLNTASYNLSSLLATILKEMIADSRYNIKNSSELKDVITSIRLKPEEELVSFDVVSLFTNIPTDLAMEIAASQWEKVSDCVNIPPLNFFQLLKFAIVDSNYFVYDGKFYKQCSGLAMGSPLAPIMADLVMEKLFNTIIPRLNFKPTISKKYVDDTIFSLPINELPSTLDALNSFHPKIKFTFETEGEANKDIPFLDMRLIRRNNQSVITDWYTKPMASNRILNFLSTHPFFQRYNVALAFARKVFSLSDKSFYSKNSTIIFNILRKNNYPIKLIKRIIPKAIHTTKSKPLVNTSPKTKTNFIYTSLLYVPHLSPAIQDAIRQDTPNIQIAFKPVKKVGQTIFTNTKEKQDKMSQSGIVYKIDCRDCDHSYIGETSKKLSTRLNRHKLDIKNKEKTGPKTALVQHTLDKKHNFDLENTQVIDREIKHGKRLILEAGHIIMNKTVNLKTDTSNISRQYYSILDTHKKNNIKTPKITLTTPIRKNNMKPRNISLITSQSN